MEKEKRSWFRAKCGHRVYDDEAFTKVASIWEDEPRTQCEPCSDRWRRITIRRGEALTQEDIDRLCGR